MHIVFLTAGAAGMYCGACLRDAALIGALRAAGHDVLVVPLYTPLKLEHELPHDEVYFGGLNVYLEQSFPPWRWIPASWRRVLDRPRTLNWIARFGLDTEPVKLGALTVSMLRGAEGHQRAQLDQLVAHLAAGPAGAADCFHLNNALLSGIAPALRARFGKPVLCSLLGEDSFLGAFSNRHQSEAREALQQNAAAIAGFLIPYADYAAAMHAWIGADRDRYWVVPPGVAVPKTTAPSPSGPFTVGYLSVITPRKGLETLVEAVIQARTAGDPLELRIAGQVLAPAYWKRIEKRLQTAGVPFMMLGELDAAGKAAFWGEVHALALPTRVPESKGLVALEAMAAGRAVLVPNHGIFPEMLQRCGGGALAAPEDVASWARILAAWSRDPAELAHLGQRGREGVARDYSTTVMAEAFSKAVAQVQASATA